MPKETLYPHVPKSRQPLFPHVPKGQQPAEKLRPELLPVARLLEKWSKTKARNSALALKDMEALGPDYDIEECRQSLLDYRDIKRENYSDAEEYQEGKDAAWEQFLESLESLAGEEEAEEEQKEEKLPDTVDKRIQEVGDIILSAMVEGRWLTLKQIRELAHINYNTPDKTLIKALGYLVEERKIVDSPATETKPHQWMLSATQTTGTCYEDAWLFIIKEKEGYLVHGTVLSNGKRIGHAWVETLTGYIWEPETKKIYNLKVFQAITKAIEEQRYTPEQAFALAQRTDNPGPWTEEERRKVIYPKKQSRR